MWHRLFLVLCTVLLAALGYQLGAPIYMGNWKILVPVVAGGFGGLGIGCAILDVKRRWSLGQRNDYRPSC